MAWVPVSATASAPRSVGQRCRGPWLLRSATGSSGRIGRLWLVRGREGVVIQQVEVLPEELTVGIVPVVVEARPRLRPSEAIFVTTVTRLSPVPPMLRDGTMVIELPRYTEAEKRLSRPATCCRKQLGQIGLTVGHPDVTDEAVGFVIRGYTREAGVWGLATVLGEPVRQGGAPSRRARQPPWSRPRRGPSLRCSARRNGTPASPAAPGRPGTRLGLCATAGGDGDVARSEPGR